MNYSEDDSYLNLIVIHKKFRISRSRLRISTHKRPTYRANEGN